MIGQKRFQPVIQNFINGHNGYLKSYMRMDMQNILICQLTGVKNWVQFYLMMR